MSRGWPVLWGPAAPTCWAAVHHDRQARLHASWHGVHVALAVPSRRTRRSVPSPSPQFTHALIPTPAVRARAGAAPATATPTAGEGLVPPLRYLCSCCRCASSVAAAAAPVPFSGAPGAPSPPSELVGPRHSTRMPRLYWLTIRYTNAPYCVPRSSGRGLVCDTSSKTCVTPPGTPWASLGLCMLAGTAASGGHGSMHVAGTATTGAACRALQCAMLHLAHHHVCLLSPFSQAPPAWAK